MARERRYSLISVHQVVFQGELGVGKSSFIYRAAWHGFFGDLPEAKRQLQQAAVSMRHMDIGERKLTLNFEDTQGVEVFRTATSSSYRSASAIVFMFDLTDANSFKTMQNWFDEFQSYASTNPRKRYVTMLIGAKSDLIEAKPSARKVTRQEAMEFVHKKEIMSYHEVSSKANTGVEEAVSDLAQKIQTYIMDQNQLPEISTKSSIHSTSTDTTAAATELQLDADHDEKERKMLSSNPQCCSVQ